MPAKKPFVAPITCWQRSLPVSLALPWPTSGWQCSVPTLTMVVELVVSNVLPKRFSLGTHRIFVHFTIGSYVPYTSKSISLCGDDGAKKTFQDGRGRGLSNCGTSPRPFAPPRRPGLKNSLQAPNRTPRGARLISTMKTPLLSTERLWAHFRCVRALF